MATSSSADAHHPRTFRTGVALIAAVIASAAMVAVALARADAWVVVVMGIAVAASLLLVAYSLVRASLASFASATSVAEALAEERYDSLPLVQATGIFSQLGSALNRAAARTAQSVDALRGQRAQLEALLNASTDAIVAVDRAGSVVYANDAARRLVAPAGGEPVGRPLIEAVRDHDLHALILAAASRGERSVRVLAYGPQQRWLQATAVPIAGAGAWAALAVFNDLTEVRRLDAVRRDFVSNVSHELRTPLAGIRAAAETLQEGALEDPAAAQEFLGHIQRETDRLTQLVEELLELSRIESGAAPLALGPLDAAGLAVDTAKRFARQAARAGVTLTAEPPSRPLPIIGDGERLERALGNLVANAIKFTPAGGSVTVRARLLADDQVAITVRDTGIGIELDQQARVWERFYKADAGRLRDGGGAQASRHESGTGLGLAIVKHIVLAHGGDVSLESRPGWGSTFTMRLPVR